MKKLIIVLAAMSSMLFMSCEKDNLDNVDNYEFKFVASDANVYPGPNSVYTDSHERDYQFIMDAENGEDVNFTLNDEPNDSIIEFSVDKGSKGNIEFKSYDQWTSGPNNGNYLVYHFNITLKKNGTIVYQTMYVSSNPSNGNELNMDF